MTRTILLPTDLTDKDGEMVHEELPVTEVEPGVFRLERSPGIVMGLAVGDHFVRRVDDPRGFEVVHRAGKVNIQVYCPHGTDDEYAYLERALEGIGGTVEGRTSRAIIGSVPIETGFPAVERTMESFEQRFPDAEW